DLPRLAYADWLDERGGEADVARAEFIRLHVSLARSAADATDRESITFRVGYLWQRHRTEWFGPAAVRLEVDCCERGLLSGLTVPWLTTLVNAAGRTEQPWPLGPVPLVDDASYRRPWKIQGCEGYHVEREESNAWPGLASWGSMRLREYGLPTLRSPHLVNLTSIEVHESAIGWRGLVVIADGMHRLRSAR